MMYWNGSGGWGWAAWLSMGFMMLLFWGVVIGAVVLLARGSLPRTVAPKATGPEDLLAERFARGEIDAEEYHARLATLRSSRDSLAEG